MEQEEMIKEYLSVAYKDLMVCQLAESALSYLHLFLLLLDFLPGPLLILKECYDKIICATYLIVIAWRFRPKFTNFVLIHEV